MSRRLVCLFLLAAAASAGPARAALGETLGDLQKRFGRPDPQLNQHAPKNVAHWSIETMQSERLIYTVTFNAKGRSIAEGLKPVRRAVLTDEFAEQFVQSQLAIHGNTAALRQPKPGEKFTFAKQEFTCAANEAIWVDEASDFMIVWVRGPKGHVLAVRAEMLAAPAP